MRFVPKFNLRKEKEWFLSRRPSGKAMFILLGIVSTIWFIVRVVPRPSRASYPCMQAAAPFAAGFIAWISGLTLSVAALRWLKLSDDRRNFPASALAMVVFITGIGLMLGGDHRTGRAGVPGLLFDESPNTPMGEARGIHPGRVVWVWDPMATDETCTNEPGDYWFQDDNADAAVIGNMLSESLRRLTGETSDSLAWDALFRHYNLGHGFGNAGYLPGEGIAIKINLTTGGWGNVDLTTYDKTANLEMMDATPQLVVAMLKQLVDIFGIPQEDISIGDPIRHFYNQYWDRCHPLFPQVHYLDRAGLLGRTKAVPSSSPVMFYSDGTISDSLPQAYVDSKYMINMGCLKQHDLAGGTFCAKNHFGSICRDWAMHLHYALPSPTTNGFENLGYGKYRNLVDLMEHRDLGEKTVLFLVDGIWGGELPVTEPVKWQIEPFNDDWPNSIFVSQDHVAIESVGFDFVKAQFDEYIDMYGADDYLHQAADSANWAEGITYDPENDGLIIPSMGVHEHWNNDIEKEYTRNLGTGDGIELVKYLVTGTGREHFAAGLSVKAYPNPFVETVRFEYKLGGTADVKLEIFDQRGSKCFSLLRKHLQPGTHSFTWDGQGCSDGVYHYCISVYRDHSRGTGNGKVVKASR